MAINPSQDMLSLGLLNTTSLRSSRQPEYTVRTSYLEGHIHRSHGRNPIWPEMQRFPKMTFSARPSISESNSK